MPETSPPGAQPRSPPLDAARGCARCPTAEHLHGASAPSKAQHLPLVLPGLEGSRVETSPRFGSHLLSSQRLQHLWRSQTRFLQVPAAAGASFALCRGERGAEAGWHPALQAAISRDAGGARGTAREGGRETHRRCPTWKGKKAARPHHTQPEGTGSPQPGSVHAVSCQPAPAASSSTAGTRHPPGRPAPCSEPRWQRLAIPAAEQLAACGRPCAMGMKSGSPRHAPPGSPTLCAASLTAPLEKKSFLHYLG